MKKYITILSITASVFLFGACSKQLDLAPVSSVSNANYWKNADQALAFVTGVHIQFRSSNTTFLYLGELRGGSFGTDPGSSSSFTGEATQGVENMWNQTLDGNNPGVSNFGGLYNNINQVNLLINRLNSTNFLTAEEKAYYLGVGYGMRAFYYFQLYRSWGDVILQTTPVENIDISNLAKGASPAADIMKQIKADIDSSASNYAADYSFKQKKGFWSKAATLMLKAEVYLWTANRGGGSADAQKALTALNDIQTNIPSLKLLPSYSDVFSKKGNDEIIFASSNNLNEATLGFIGNFVPQSGFIQNYYDSVGNMKFDASNNWGGLLRAPTRIATFRQFDDKDSRKWVSIQPAYNKSADGSYSIAGCFMRKYTGEQNAGVRNYTNDFIIYRYADLLLLKATAEIIIGTSPKQEINEVRQRAFGSNYNPLIQGYPNQPVDTDPKEAVLQERLLEFLLEGKRWYDLRSMGDQYVYEHTSLKSSEAYKLLWPIDLNSLTNNRDLVQNPGYPKF
ncbi:MAG TPA: SusD family outer membrane lipoprotein NanU [Arachidicoccus sp.]|nr:SusD family outer membrane lipoprotein NanU [Arachidicoccus sp.]